MPPPKRSDHHPSRSQRCSLSRCFFVCGARPPRIDSGEPVRHTKLPSRPHCRVDCGMEHARYPYKSFFVDGSAFVLPLSSSSKRPSRRTMRGMVM